MSLPQPTGYLDYGLGYIVPYDASTWSSTTGTTWANFSSWSVVSADPLIWVADMIDIGTVMDFNLMITATYDGEISYDIYASRTGQFQGEETVFSITNNTSSIPSFNGRYVHVVAKVTKTTGLNVLKSMNITLQRKAYTMVLSDLDTSTLAGDVTARILPLTKPVSKVLAINILPRDVRENGYFAADYIASGYVGDSTDGYVTNDYWTNDYTMSAYIPMVTAFQVSKDRNGPAVCLRNEYGEYLDGELDAVITVLPEQYMSNGQLLTR